MAGDSDSASIPGEPELSIEPLPLSCGKGFLIGSFDLLVELASCRR
jgi:hypothetical protein